jgi:hypothetical protein
MSETGYDNQPSNMFDGEVDSYSDEAEVKIQALINGKKRKVFENGDEFSPATKKRSAVIEMAKEFANYTIHKEKQVSMFKAPYDHLEPRPRSPRRPVGLVGKTCEQKQGLMFEVPYEHLEPRSPRRPVGLVAKTCEEKQGLMFEVPYEHLEPRSPRRPVRLVGKTCKQKQGLMFEVPYEHLEPRPRSPRRPVGLVGKTLEQKQDLMFEVPYEDLGPIGQIAPNGQIVPSGQIAPSGPMNHNGSLGDNGQANYGGLVGPYSPKPPVTSMSIGLSGHSNAAIGLGGHSNAANKLKQQLEQQDQVQFYQKIKHELQVEEHQQMVKKFYQQQKLAFDFPKVIFPSGQVYRNGPYCRQATSQTVCSNNFRRPRLSATICASPMRPATIVHENFIIAKNWLGQECKV